MPKNVIQDVLPPGGRSIRNIPLSNQRRKSVPPPFTPPVEESRPPVPERRPKKSVFGKIFILLAILAIGGFVFFLLTTFSSAEVTVTPKRENITFDLPVEIFKNPTNANLRFEVIELKKETELEVPANGEEMVERKASGKILIYNTFSSDPQRLIARTRFQTPEGLVYRIAESVVVPGAKTAGGKTEPGTLQVVVYADEAGDKYNVGPTQFTIPGFKDDPKRFSGFYAKSEGALSGGIVGKVKKVAEADREAARVNMKNSLTLDLEKEIAAKMPENLVALKGGVIYEFIDLAEQTRGEKVFLKQEGVAKVIVLEKEALASSLAEQMLKSWGGIKAEIESFDKISITFNKTPDLSLPSLEVRINGEAPVVAEVDEALVAGKLASKPKNDLKVILADFPSILSAKVSIKPVWKSAFPADVSKIHVRLTPID